MDLLFKKLIDEALEEFNFPPNWTIQEIEELREYRPVIKFRSDDHYNLMNDILLEISKIPQMNDYDEFKSAKDVDSKVDIKALGDIEINIDFHPQICSKKELKEIAKILIPIVHFVPKAGSILKFYEQNEKFIRQIIKMSGRQLTDEKRMMYREILKIQGDLYNQFGSGHKSSLTTAIWAYSTRYKLHWTEKKVKSTAQTISDLKEEGKLD